MIGLKAKIMIKNDYVFCPDRFKPTDIIYNILSNNYELSRPINSNNLYTCAYDRSFTKISKCRKCLECLHEKCISKDEEIMAACTTHISCLLKNVIDKCHLALIIKTNVTIILYTLLIQLDVVLDCRKILSDYSSLRHCHENFIILCNDGSCCSIKIL